MYVPPQSFKHTTDPISPRRGLGTKPRGVGRATSMPPDDLPVWEHPGKFSPKSALEVNNVTVGTGPKSSPKAFAGLPFTVKSPASSTHRRPSKVQQRLMPSKPDQLFEGGGADIVFGRSTRSRKSNPADVSVALIAAEKKRTASKPSKFSPPSPLIPKEEINLPANESLGHFVPPLTPTFGTIPRTRAVGVGANGNDPDTSLDKVVEVVRETKPLGKHLSSIAGINRRDITLSSDKGPSSSMTPVETQCGSGEATRGKLHFPLRHEHHYDAKTTVTASTCSMSTSKSSPTARISSVLLDWPRESDAPRKSDDENSMDSSESSMHSYYFKQTEQANPYIGGPMYLDEEDDAESVYLALHEQENEMMRMALELSLHDRGHDSHYSLPSDSEADSFGGDAFKREKSH